MNPGLYLRSRRALGAVALTFAFAAPLAAQSERVDIDAISRIKDEGMNRSQVMEITSYLSDVYGPRLTGSPFTKEAADYAMKKMREWGISNVHLETFPFGRGWVNERLTVQALSPRPYPIIAYPGAWSVGTNGPVTAQVVVAVIDSEPDMARYKGKLRGKIVFVSQMRDVPAHFTADAHRFSDAELAEMAQPPAPRPNAGAGRRPGGNMAAMQAFAQKRTQFFIDEGAAVLVYAGRGEEGTVWPTGNGSRDPKAPRSLPTITMAIEHYGRIYRTLEKNIPVTLTVDMKNRFYDNDLNSFNILGEIPGSDRKDEIVMLGAHFDSWHSGTGATDNAAGSAVMLEALRILKTLNLPLRRTVRIGLWTGEEQGLIGSREYVKAHFGDRQTMQLTPAHAKFSSYYNVDNGTGQIRGVYLQENAAVAPIFTAWLEPFAEWGASTITIRNTGGTDHQAFDAVGLPGFQFIQDPIHYDTRTHHTNMDTYERIQAQDMMRNAVIVASFVYQAANREELIPRKTTPVPVGGGR